MTPSRLGCAYFGAGGSDMGFRSTTAGGARRARGTYRLPTQRLMKPTPPGTRTGCEISQR